MLPLRDLNPRSSRPWVTYAIAALCVGVYLYQAYLGTSLQGFLFTLRFGFIPERLLALPLAGAPSLVTSLFLHGGLLHLAGNLLFLIVFGDNIEDRMGHLGFAVFYLVGGALANLVYAFATDAPRIPLVGASGAVSAVLGAYLLLFPRLKVLTFLPPLLLPWLVASLFARVPRFFLLWFPAWLFIGYWFLIQVVEATAGAALAPAGATSIAWWAHVGGFAFGVAGVRAFARRGSASPWR